eukprot:TRINITY_DN2295_c0_g1_i1.p1 TRINITY_DN2295_c0_g1~~TRINITY_DN2295_c0_g1_i1.p1  ORF type:complete len:332 (-),score=80.37 TRINITY_DN2295_c0_g1_i1:67-1062(-)
MSARAIGVKEGGGVEVLKEFTFHYPPPAKGEILVRLKAASVNPVDTKRRKAPEKYEQPRILGWDGAGVVEQLGDDVHSFKVGDEVWFAGDVRKSGTYSEVVNIDHRLVSVRPKNISFVDASTLPLVSLTAWEAFFEQLQLKEGEVKNLFILNGAGGVGSVAIQIAKNVLKVPRIIVSASRQETIDFVKKLGATDVVDHRKSLPDQFKALGVNPDVVLLCHDTNNALLQDIVSFTTPFGKIVSILPFTEPIQTVQIFLKRITLSFELMFVRSGTGVHPEKQGEILAKVAKLVDEGLIVAPTTLVKNLWKDIQEVHTILESGKAIGKIALTLD